MTKIFVGFAVAVLSLVANFSAADEERDRALMTPPVALDSRRASTTDLTDPLADLRGIAPLQREESPLVDVQDGTILAKVEIPKGEGYEATISSNGQGLLVELGKTALDANGKPVLNADGSSKRQTLTRGLVVKKGDILGKQQDDELVQERIVATQELIVAQKEADKTLEIEVAEAAALVAQASYKRAEALNKAVPGSVSPEEIQEKKYDWLRAGKSVDKAKYDLEVNQEKVKVADARVNAIDVQIRNRKFFSPIDGVIDDLYVNEGEWLREGTEVLHIIRLDKVLIAGAIPEDEYAPEDVDGKEVTIFASRRGEQAYELTGKVVYVRQLVESGHYYFYAEVENQKTEGGYWILSPGALVRVKVNE